MQWILQTTYKEATSMVTNDGVIRVSGKIDSTNAEQFETELFAAAGQDYGDVTINCKELEYISSAGLRVFLKLKKGTKGIVSLVDVSREVYEIFQMTGFTEILQVKKELRTISVDGCEVIGKGGHGTVYRLDGDTIIKVYKSTEPLEDIEREIDYAKNAFISGIPTAIAFDIVKCGDNYGTVFELLNADTLSHVLTTHPEKYDEYSKKYNEFIHKIHTTEADTSRFTNVKDLYNQLTDQMATFLTDEEVTLIHEIINSVPDRNTYVHGDIHPKNIMVQNGELILIDMADITYGHPVFDYGGMHLTHVTSGETFSFLTKQIIGVKHKIAQNLYEDFLRSEFGDKSEAEYQRIKEVIAGISHTKFTLSSAVNKNHGKAFTQFLVSYSRKHFLGDAAKLINSVDF